MENCFSATGISSVVSTLFRCWLGCRFGKVISGHDVVSAIEQVGSESGATRVNVVIADSGQLR